MKLEAGKVLFARIDYKIEGQEETQQDGLDTMNYLQRLAKERYLVAGVFGDMELGDYQGAMTLFEAEDLEEAKELCENDPIIKRGLYRYEVYKWNMMISSE